MQKYFHSKLYVVFTLVILVSFAYGIFASGYYGVALKKNAPEKSAILGDVPSETLRWNARMDEVGAREAYKEFKSAYASEPFDSQHAVAHVIGDLLYEHEGLQGIGICDEAFAFGCYHSFFAKVFADFGEEMIDDLDAECIKMFGKDNMTGCEHGIGHGILEYMGHANLTRTLEACTRTAQPSPFFGCTSGVFMEFNNPTIWDGGRVYTETRKLDKMKPYEPCESIPDNFRESCYFEISLWWKEVFKGDFDKIGELCGAIKAEQGRTACFSGTGSVVAATAEYDALKTVELCKKMRSGSDLCRINALWRFTGFGVKDKKTVDILCAGVTPHEHFRCAL